MMDDSNTANAFLKAALFTQVLKTSVALSVFKSCPPGHNVENFVHGLQNAHAFYEVYRDKSFYHANQLKASVPLDFEEISRSISYSEKKDDYDCLKDCLSRFDTGITSIRIGLRGLLDTSTAITENFILPGATFVFQSLSWVATYNEVLEEVNLLNQAALLDEKANDVLKIAGEISAKLDAAEQPTTEIMHFMVSILDLTCIVKQDDIYLGWLPPTKNFLISYIRAIQKNEGFKVPYLANSLCKHLLNRCCGILGGTVKDSALINESFSRIHSLLCPLLNAHQRKVQIGADLIETIIKTNGVIEGSQFIKNGESQLSNGSIGLLNVLKNKLQFLVNLSP